MLAELHIEDFGDGKFAHWNTYLSAKALSIDDEFLALFDANTILLEQPLLRSEDGLVENLLVFADWQRNYVAG